MDKTNTDKILDVITTEDVIKILLDLGSVYPKTDIKGNLYFSTVCHGGDSHKLYYFTDTKFFICFTCCGSMSLYDLVMSSKNISFSESLDYICNLKGISRNTKKGRGLKRTEVENTDLDFLKYHVNSKEKIIFELPSYNQYVLNVFDNYLPMSWYKEGIKEDIAEYFNIKFYISQNKAIIPHYDINGNLVGIRARSFVKQEVENGKKYMPICIQGLTYRYPTNFNLYGVWQNKNNIKKLKKVILFESEKSLLIYGSLFGQENNIALALSGLSFSLYQRDLILSLDIEEVVIALDKQYLIEIFEDDNIDKNSKQWKEYENYIKRIIKISEMLLPYCNVSVLSCWDDRIGYKDAPIDKGKEIFEELYRERYQIGDIEEVKEMIK